MCQRHDARTLFSCVHGSVLQHQVCLTPSNGSASCRRPFDTSRAAHALLNSTCRHVCAAASTLCRVARHHTLPCCPPPELGCAAGDDSEEGLWVPSSASPGRGGLCRGRGPGRRAASPGGATPPGSPHPHGRQPPTVRSGRMALQRKPVQGACALASRRTAVRGSDRGRVGSCSACVRLVAASCGAAQATLMHNHSQAYDAGRHPSSQGAGPGVRFALSATWQCMLHHSRWVQALGPSAM